MEENDVSLDPDEMHSEERTVNKNGSLYKSSRDVRDFNTDCFSTCYLRNISETLTQLLSQKDRSSSPKNSGKKSTDNFDFAQC